MKKLSLYIFLLLMFCDIAQAVPLENLIVGVIITVIGFGVVNLFNIDPLFLFSIVYGFFIFIFFAVLILTIMNPSIKKRKKELREHFEEMSYFFILMILVFGGLLIFR
tara:strand:+ start:42 stop:365 length:324 start_codon:yes stop_codon:yes gene_type:complete